MSQFLADYLDRGLSSIVVLDHEFKESASGHTDSTRELVIARKGKHFVETTVHQHIRYLKDSGSSTTFSETKISYSEYSRRSCGKQVLDTPEAVDDFRRWQKKAKREQRSYSRFLKAAPNCPACKKRMTLRSGKYGSFWGC